MCCTQCVQNMQTSGCACCLQGMHGLHGTLLHWASSWSSSHAHTALQYTRGTKGPVVGRRGLLSGLRCQYLLLTLSAASTEHQLASQLKTSRWPVGTLAVPCTSSVKPRCTAALQKPNCMAATYTVSMCCRTNSVPSMHCTQRGSLLVRHGLTPCTRLMQLICSIHITTSSTPAATPASNWQH
jgi:hypothetical protein